MTDAALRTLLAEISSRVEFDAKRHAYSVDGEALLPVTRITGTMDKPALPGWAGNLAIDEAKARAAEWYENSLPVGNVIPMTGLSALTREIELARGAWNRDKKRTSGLGKEVHALIEAECHARLGEKSAPVAASDEARHIFAGWQIWAEEVGLEPIAAEARLYHPEHKYAGTMDLLARTKEWPLVVLDWKTVDDDALDRPIYAENQLQSIGYQGCLRAHGIMDAVGMVTKLSRNGAGKPKTFPVFWSDADFAAFLSLADVARWIKARER